jgi:hypothetical protein
MYDMELCSITQDRRSVGFTTEGLCKTAKVVTLTGRYIIFVAFVTLAYLFFNAGCLAAKP